jgi:hypothetical protein
MNEMSKISDVVDTTDSLEAIGACKCMKNLLFAIVLVCLLLLQGVFWLNRTGNIDMVEEAAPVATVKADVPDEQSGKAPVAKKTAEEAQADEAVKKVAGEDNEAGEESVAKIAQEPAVNTISKYKYVIPKYAHVVGLIRVCNFVLIVTSTLYCLVLLVSLKVSLIGRLGGISHISKAFFLSLFALAILLPWQSLFSGFAMGAIYAPDELFSGWTLWGETLVSKILYYLRFSGLWLLALLLIMMAQCRSGKWARTTLKRLGVLR